MEKEATVIKTDAEPETQGENVLVFSRPYEFEGRTITQVDLDGLNDVTTGDLIAASNYITRKGVIAPMPEMTFEFAAFIMARATALPIEFYMGLKAKDAIKMKNRATAFFYGED